MRQPRFELGSQPHYAIKNSMARPYLNFQLQAKLCYTNHWTTGAVNLNWRSQFTACQNKWARQEFHGIIQPATLNLRLSPFV